jgi:hypothetical protein
MKRSAPMKRTAFRSKAPPPRTMAVMARPNFTAAVPVPKLIYVRDDRIRLACQRLECQHCGRDDGTITWAHSNWGEHGKGRSIKASDIYVAAMCAVCHYLLDQGRTWSAEERLANWLAAHRKTIRKLLALGWWPKDIEPPQLGDGVANGIATCS